MIYFLLSLVLCIGLSLFTIQFFKGYGTGTNYIDAVKMGYPIFWFNLLLAAIAIVNQNSQLNIESGSSLLE